MTEDKVHNTRTCSVCHKVLSLNAFPDSCLRQRRYWCRACTSVKASEQKNKPKDSFHTVLRLIRDREKRAGRECLLADIEDVKDVFYKYEGRCILSGRAHSESNPLTLIRVNADHDISRSNAVPVCKSFARRHAALPQKYKGRLRN